MASTSQVVNHFPLQNKTGKKIRPKIGAQVADHLVLLTIFYLEVYYSFLPVVFFRRIYGHCPFAGVVGAVGALGAVIDRFPQVLIDGKAAQQRVFVGYTTEI